MSDRPDSNSPVNRTWVKGDRSNGRVDNSQIFNGDIHAGSVHLGSPLGTTAAEEHEAPDSNSKARPGISVAAMIAIAFIAYLIFGNDSATAESDFPSENGQRPAGSTDEAVLAATMDALRTCARTPMLEPANCPQRSDGHSEGPVTWKIHGSPADGAIIVYNGSEGRFHVFGTAAMTVSYQGARQRELKLHIVNYWSRVEWAGGKAKVAEIKQYDGTSPPKVAKRDPRASDETLLRAVRKTFDDCFSSNRSPLPAQCPRSPNFFEDDKVDWKLHGNPTLNAKATFDAKTGLVHVVGDYSATASYDAFLLGRTSQSEGGRYDAVVVVDNTPQTLIIEAK